MRTTYETKLLAHYIAAQPSDIAAGESWYREARRTCRALAREFGVSLRTAAGVVAALSPRVTWSQNIRLACDALAGIERPIGAFRANASKAAAIVRGVRPLAILGGSKVRAFYRALVGDESASVVDVWMARAMRIRKLSSRVYERAVMAMRRVAAYVGTTVARLQAIVWTVVRGSHV